MNIVVMPSCLPANLLRMFAAAAAAAAAALLLVCRP